MDSKQNNDNNNKKFTESEKFKTEFEKERHYATQEAVKTARLFSDKNTQGRILEANFEKYWD